MAQRVSSQRHPRNSVDLSMRVFPDGIKSPSLRMPHEFETGWHTFHTFSEGFSVCACEYRFSEATNVATAMEDDPIISFDFLLEGSTALRSANMKSASTHNGPCCLLNNVSGDVHLSFGAHERVRNIGICLNLEGLHRVLGDGVSLLPRSWQTMGRPQSKGKKYNLHQMPPQIHLSAHTAFNSLKSNGSALRLFLESRALELVVLCLHELTGQSAALPAPSEYIAPRDREKLETAKDILRMQIAEPPTIAALSRRVGMNDCKLKALFKQHFNTTVYGFVRSERMRLAKRYLEQGMSVGQTANEVGYFNFSHFSRKFRKHHGVLPSAILGRK